MEHYYHTIQGWFNYISIYKHAVATAKEGDHFVEVGAWKGMSTSFMTVEIINSGKKITFDVVDTWAGSLEHKEDQCVKDDTLYNEFLTNMASVKGHYTPRRMSSLEAAKTYENNSLAFVLIDASHSYKDVKEDILAWLPKVKLGGILAGDDYHPSWSGVIQAVKELVPEAKIIDNVTWMYEKKS